MIRRKALPSLRALLLGGIAGACAAAPLAVPARAEEGPRKEREAPPAVRTAEKSRLPYPDQSDVLVDAAGMPAGMPGTPGGGIQRVAVLVFRPPGDDLRWADLVRLHQERDLLPPGARAELSILTPPPPAALGGPDANNEETNVYRAAGGRDLLVLGFIRNLRTQHLLAYSVLLAGRLEPAAAVAPAREAVHSLAAAALAIRKQAPPAAGGIPAAAAGTLPAPPGSMPAAPTARLTGPLIARLLQSIESSPLVTPRVKEMARSVLPQASAVTLHQIRTRRPMTDQEFFLFYTTQAAKLGWGAPLIQDRTQPGQPALLFRRPPVGALGAAGAAGGVVMVRAQSAPVAGPGPLRRPATTIFILEIDGAATPAS